MKNPSIYNIPIEDKYIVYAPLKRRAYIGNEALVSVIKKKLEGQNLEPFENNEIISTLTETGFFEPDINHFENPSSDQSFFPTTCILMPTTACNLACTYCYAGYEGKKTVSLTWELARKAMDTAFENSKKSNARQFSLSFHGGGEPSLPMELFLRAAKYARKLDPDCPISLTSNCVWDQEFRREALEILDEVSISFDGNKITQDRQRPDKKGMGTFSRVMETIREIEQKNIRYGIRMTVTKESLPELYSNIEFLCNDTACLSFQVEAVYNQGRAEGAGLTINDVDQFVCTFMDAYDYAKSKGRHISYSAARPHLITNMFCSATSNALIVTSDGELTACYEVFDHSHPLAEEFIFGRLDGINGINFYPGKRENLLAKIAANRNNCEDCFCFYHCAGDCPPKAFLAQQNNDRFRCLTTMAITKELILEKLIENNGFWQENSAGFPNHSNECA
jgi:uncharacterized protein